MSGGRQRRPLPLATWAAVVLAATVLIVLVVVGLVLSTAEHMTHLPALAAGLGAGACVVVIGTVLAQRVGADLRRLSAQATEGAGGARSAAPLSVATDWMSELHQLAMLLDGLRLRARVAEEMTEQAQRTSETASAGMFELLSGLVAAEEATRGQLSAELHDTVAQTLAAARAILANPEGQPGAWERVRELVEDADEQVRAAMARARPPELRDRDLASAVAGLRREMSARYLLQTKLAWPAQPYPLPLVSAVTVYRFFQEALLNIVKHADVDEAYASLTVADGLLVATVRDEGPGFDPEQVKSTGGRHVGLGLLSERARLAGGTLDVETKIGHGTTLTLRLPLGPRPAGNGARVRTAKT